MNRLYRSIAPALFVLGTAATASAHISLERGSTHKARYPDTEQKIGPCGRQGGTRSENVYVYEPGQTIEVEMVEFISHPGYFRIAFDDDGDDAFKDPQSIDPPFRECLDDPKDHCGESDFYNNDAVLPEMDELNVHNADYSSGPKTYSWDVKLPNVECDNCTLQLIQVMQDPYPIHAPFTPGEEDIYYQCIDLELKRSGSAPGAGGDNGGSGGGSSGEAADDEGGCTVAPGHRDGHETGGAALLALSVFGLALSRRRRFSTASC